MTTNAHGGKREGAGRPPTGKPEYLRSPVLAPKTDDQKAAIAWWESLSPRDRLAYIKELWQDCGWPRPHVK